jgi:hypothetical protein
MLVIYPRAYAQTISDNPQVIQVDTNADDEDMTTSNKDENDTAALRKISESKWKQIQKDKDFIYTREEKKEQKPAEAKEPPFHGIGNFFNSAVFKFLMFALVALLVLIVIYHLFFSEGRLRLKKPSASTKQPESMYEQVDTFSDWESALSKALQAKDYRLSTRILYLETLQKMNRHGWIEYEQEKTNWDYVNQFASHTNAAEFTQLTKYFDYIWYGHFVVDENRFNDIHQLYKNFHNEIK